ncbi:MAG: DUF192 domain-containing protein [Rhodobacteraceae bacterium]|nr:DUF192 domain-containing protein [Paracoccaceae bacterium]MCY4137162.1 DUF192 domain-containing protein [Paracoccaceae bacterium]
MNASPTTGQSVLAKVALIAFLALLVPDFRESHAAEPACDETKVQLRWANGRSSFNVELADDAESRARGLMHREALAPFSAMLFVYPTPRKARFWMKDTLIPLDVLFFDHRGVLKMVHGNAQPFSLETFDGGEGIQYVLEINAGMSRDLGIPVGSELRHPSIDSPDAAWPCR